MLCGPFYVVKSSQIWAEAPEVKAHASASSKYALSDNVFNVKNSVLTTYETKP